MLAFFLIEAFIFFMGLLWVCYAPFNENLYVPLGFTDTEKESWERYQQRTSKTAPIFTAHQIITFYNTAPKKWEYTQYFFYKNNGRCIYYPYICYENQEIAIDNIQDFVAVTRYFDKIIAERKAKEAAEQEEIKRKIQEQKRKAQEQMRYEKTLALLPKLREDARRTEEEANRMMEKCEREMKEIAERLQGREG